MSIENRHQVLLIGKNGQLGFEINRILAPLADVVSVDIEQFDLTKPTIIRSMVRQFRPNLIVNAAAYTDVEKAEEEPELAHAVNSNAPGLLAEEAKSIGAAIVHYSTDYVFDGSKRSPYLEEDPPNPLNAYGRSKLAGESAIRATGVPHLIVRTSWLYGTRGKNFLLTVLRLAKNQKQLSVVDDQVGAPTWCRTLADVTAKMLIKLNWSLPLLGETYHVTASGSTSWFDFAKAILSQVPFAKARRVGIAPVSTSGYPTKAKRPLNSLLSNDKLFRDFGISLPNWEEDLRSVISLLDRQMLDS